MTQPAQFVTEEIASQPQMWRQAAELAPTVVGALPGAGERIAVVGCGTSWFIAQAYAAYREEAGQGVTDAFAASEFPAGRAGEYARIVAITRSGTTTEVLQLLQQLGSAVPRTVLVGDPDSPAATDTTLSEHRVVLDFADEKSVVQTRFATSALALLRAGLGEDLTAAIADAETALAAQLPTGWQDKRQFVYLGHGPTVGLANEAALKMREAAIAWAESYPAYDFRHGPIAVPDAQSLVWILGETPDGLVPQIEATGATVEHGSPLDPMAELVRAQRLAIALALHRGYDPDTPRNLTRSIVLDGAAQGSR